MGDNIKVTGKGRRDTSKLFARGGRGKHYFISRPSDPDEAAYFDHVYQLVEDGDIIHVDATLGRGKRAYLNVPPEFGASEEPGQEGGLDDLVEEPPTEVTGLPIQVADPSDAIVTATPVSSVDLYTIIHTTKEAQFAEYGQHGQINYEGKMAALEAGKAEQRLSESSLARDIVRAILDFHKPVMVTGNDSPWKGGYTFPGYTERQVGEELGILMNECGLLDFTFSGCMSPNHYALESEFIVTPAEGTLAKGMMRSEYSQNRQLRDALREFLKPYEHEELKYEQDSVGPGRCFVSFQSPAE